MPAHGLGSGREVSESCLEALLLETCAHYSSAAGAGTPKAALESIGFQVGLQLVERCVRAGAGVRAAWCGCTRAREREHPSPPKRSARTRALV
jgi:hypothetical protein